MPAFTMNIPFDTTHGDNGLKPQAMNRIKRKAEVVNDLAHGETLVGDITF